MTLRTAGGTASAGCLRREYLGKGDRMRRASPRALRLMGRRAVTFHEHRLSSLSRTAIVASPLLMRSEHFVIFPQILHGGVGV